MKLFTKNELQHEIDFSFPYYKYYKDFLDLTYDELSTDALPVSFDICEIKQSNFIQERAYLFDEKIQLFDNVFSQIKDYIDNIKFTDIVLIMPEYKMNTLIPKNKKNYKAL